MINEVLCIGCGKSYSESEVVSHFGFFQKIKFNKIKNKTIKIIGYCRLGYILRKMNFKCPNCKGQESDIAGFKGCGTNESTWLEL